MSLVIEKLTLVHDKNRPARVRKPTPSPQNYFVECASCETPLVVKRRHIGQRCGFCKAADRLGAGYFRRAG